MREVKEEEIGSVIGASCKNGEAGDVRSLLDEFYTNPDTQTLTTIKKYVAHQLPKNNSFDVDPKKLEYRDDGWCFC